jgi:protocatechuate 3,4-dioxygenase beta subunit
MSELHQMPSQTVGTFFGYSLHSEGGTELLPAHSRGTIRCHGAAVDSWGHFSLTTITPGAMRERSAPYILVTIFTRELLQHPFTRAYFGESDSFLAGLGGRAATLIATADGESSYRFDIHLQGESETVFIDYEVDAGA